MKFYKIDMRGKFFVQRGTSDPSTTSSDEGRIFYNTTEKYLKLRNDSGWDTIITESNASSFIGGSGSGFNADLLDGKDSSEFADVDLGNVSATDVLNKVKAVDGAGSGLDADLLDGQTSDSFANNDLSNVGATYVLNKVKSVDGAGSGLDADMLDGHNSTYFATSNLSNVGATYVLNKVKSVDGSGSGLDADRLDGYNKGANGEYYYDEKKINIPSYTSGILYVNYSKHQNYSEYNNYSNYGAANNVG